MDGTGLGKRTSRFGDSDEMPAQKRMSVDIAAATARAAELSKKLLGNIAQMSSVLNNAYDSKVNKSLLDKKAAYRPLLLDASGRAIDEHGNLLKQEGLVKTLAANVAVEKTLKKKENPYLAHRAPTIVAPVTASANQEEQMDALEVVDDRLPKAGRRDLKANKSLKFIEAGTLVKEADKAQHKEERKLIAGYASGRKNLEHKDQSEESQRDVVVPQTPIVLVPPPLDLVVPSMEWWDEAFLPKDIRENRKISKAAADKDDFAHLSATNSKTIKYIQHPVPVKPLGHSTNQTVVLPMFLTKKEMKKLRKSTRQEREREKRDKQMMGLIPAPEPKFKLSNFMKVLGDQAVADPSKVELRVLQQMQQRVLNHEMRNQAAKLTPKERKDKKVKKLHEDTSRSVSVAVFRVKDLSNLKHRFKVDVNAQQHFLSGIVLLCAEEGRNLVVAEGGPKGIRKFVRLMTERIRWTDTSESADHEVAVEDFEDDDEDDDHRGDEMEQEAPQMLSSNGSALNSFNVSSTERDNSQNRCDLLWQGVLPKRVFTGFKFQESKSSTASRKMLEAKGAAQYWDMVEAADQLLASAEMNDF